MTFGNVFSFLGEETVFSKEMFCLQTTGLWTIDPFFVSFFFKQDFLHGFLGWLDWSIIFHMFLSVIACCDIVGIDYDQTWVFQNIKFYYWIFRLNFWWELIVVQSIDIVGIDYNQTRVFQNIKLYYWMFRCLIELLMRNNCCWINWKHIYRLLGSNPTFVSVDFSILSIVVCRGLYLAFQL